jgi:DnaJ-domain-containing protein 1
LGCSSSASGQEIKQRYRQLVQHWHPDRIAGRGASTEELLHTTEILQIINAAYETALRGVA